MQAYTKLKENRQGLRDIIPLPKPFTLVVEPSSLCNFKCTMCFQSTSSSRYFADNRRNMPFELYENIIRQIKDWDGGKFKVMKLSLYGEPFLNPRFCDMLALASNSYIAERIETTSNVSLLTPYMSRRLITGKLDYLRVSVYSPDQDKHERITGSNIKVGVIHENLRVLQAIKREMDSKTPFVAVKMLDAYSDENERFREMYSDVADEVYIDKPHNWVGSEEKSFTRSLYGGDNPNFHTDMQSQDNGQYACGQSFYILSVRSNGDIAPCCVDYAGGTNVGNINDTSLKEIWQGEPMRHFWTTQLSNNKHQNPSCRNCEIYRSSYYSRDNVDGVSIERLL
ncbi:radical SAM protein [Synergistales bacterium]|nr:radical SAM protein [Synergistales bacterium]